MPTGAIEDEQGVGAGLDTAADLGQVQAHQFSVDGGQHKRCSGGPRRSDGAEDIGPAMVLIAALAAGSRGAQLRQRVILSCYRYRHLDRSIQYIERDESQIEYPWESPRAGESSFRTIDRG